MKTSLNVDNFCNPYDSRIYLSQPFQFNGRTIACNGHIFVSTPEHGDYLQCPEDYSSKILALIEKFNPSEFVPMPNLVFPEKISCPKCLTIGKCTIIKCIECEGEGEISWHSGFNDYEAVCLSCDGDGEISKSGGDKTCLCCLGSGHVYGLDSYVDISGLKINPHYLELITDEPVLEISVDTKEDILVFRSGENYGLIKAVNYSEAAP
jgi:hypothetical protein